MAKKLLSVLLIVCMVASLSACKKSSGHKVGGQLIIGDTTELGGDWVPYFQNGAADFNIFNLTTGYALVETNKEGEFLTNKTVVKKYDSKANDDGTKTYTWTIKDGLKFSDGTPITAKDYVSTIMLWSSKVVADMGADNSYGLYLNGWKDFATGASKEFKGVRLIDDKTIELTISAEYLPYFYELSMVTAYPTKLSFWTDDTVEIKDDGNGCYFSDNFTKEAYEAKINAGRNMADNRIATGPYYLKSYDEATKMATLEVNKEFKGNFEGQKPSIQTIVYKKVTSETALDELKTGNVDILYGMASGDEINGGLDLVDAGGFNYSSYDRAGYGRLCFSCDFGPTQFVEVRHAIAYLLDRNEFAKAFTGGFGTVVNGPFGEAMWFYKEAKDTLDEKLQQYPYSTDNAIAELEKGGWVLDKDGNPYSSGIRYKKLDDGTLMPLIIEWCSSEQNPVSDLLVVKLQENPDVAAAGMQINQTVMTFTELLNYEYRDGSVDPKYAVPTYNMYNMGVGFTPLYDMSLDYTTDPDLLAQGRNTNFIIDKDLEAAAKAMVQVDPTDKKGFVDNFVKFTERWNELLPDLPLYSNIYHDFYNEKLKNYEANAIWDITSALLYAYIEE